MAIETLQYEGVDRSVSRLWASEREVVSPAFQVSIQFRNQTRQGLMTLRTVRHRPQLVPLPLQSLLRGHHDQVEMPAPFQVAVVPERVSQKVQARFLFFQVHHPRLLAVDLQPHPGLQLLLDIPARWASDSAPARQNHRRSAPVSPWPSGPALASRGTPCRTSASKDSPAAVK